MSFNKLIQYQNEYNGKFPDDEFNAFDYFHSLGTDRLIEIFEASKGRKIVLETSENDDNQEIKSVQYVEPN
jgi:hypothetical protein